MDGEMLVVFDFEGFLKRRERAYKYIKLREDPKFEECRCTVEADREIVRERILRKYASIAEFDVLVKSKADSVLEEFRQVGAPSEIDCQRSLRNYAVLRYAKFLLTAF